MYDKQEALDQLREILKPGDTVHCILRHVSASGMTRWISLIKLDVKDGKPVARDISWLAAKAMDWKVNTQNHDGIKVEGCGMDMGFHLVYSLSYALYGGEDHGYACLEYIGQHCPSNSHVNGRGGREERGVHYDGYALSSRWL